MTIASLAQDYAVEEFEPSHLSVLLVDDDAFAIGLERRILERLGIRNIVTAGDGEEALAFLQTGLLHFDVILSDLRMPNVDGIELLKKVRASWPEIPFLLLTADRTETSVLSAQGLGVDAYVTKPFSPAQLLKTLKVIFERRDPSGLLAWQRSDEYKLLHTEGLRDVTRLYELWDERRHGRAMPEATDFLPIETSPLAVLEPHLMLLELQDNGRIRFLRAGQIVERDVGLKLEGTHLDEQPTWFRRHAETGIRNVKRYKRPTFQSVKTIQDFRILHFQRLALPVAESGRGVAYALCVFLKV